MKSAIDVIVFYKKMEKVPNSQRMLREIRWQYTDMANGGDGGDLGFEENGETTCRAVNYPGYPDSFFQEVCSCLGWKW